jgi:dihydropteroate synthase
MSRVNPLSKHHLLYLGEISEPPHWLPSRDMATVAPILDHSRVGAFSVENPSTDEIRCLKRTAQESSGVVSVFKAGGADFCVYIGSRDELCKRVPASETETALGCEDFIAAVERYSARNFTLSLPSADFVLGERTRIMGILNVTHDSFSDGGRFHNFDAAVAQGEKMAEEGADMVDVGGESTRPGSRPVPVEEEAERVIPVVKHLAGNLPIPISIDTCKAEIARRALDAGAEIVNDVTAFGFDEEMISVVRDSGCPVIIMHMRRTPKDMQHDPHYDALMPEIISFLRERIQYAAERGVSAERLVVDPGIGFGKTVEHNLEILRELDRLRALGRPILVGTSRKSTIGAVLDAEVHDRVEGTAATVALAIANGAHIVRVHDVKELARVAKMTDAIIGRRWD